MKKQLGIFLAVIFFCMQMGSFAHMAEHGFEYHEHSEHPCQIEAYFNASLNIDSSVNKVGIAHNISSETIRIHFVDSSQRVFELSSSKHSRAPPHIS